MSWRGSLGRTRASAVAFVAGLLLGACVPCSAEPALPGGGALVSPQTVKLTDAEAIERPIMSRLNAVRRAHGLRALKLSPALARAADDHVRALALAGQFRHEWSDGRPFKVWIRRYYPIGGAHFWSVGEDLIWSSPSLEVTQAAKAWLASPPHRRVLLMPSWRRIGVGVVQARGAGGVYGGANVYVGAADFGVRW